MKHTAQISQGLKKNWKQFVLLLIVNAFVGGMIGIERTIFPEYAKQGFGIDSATAILSFIAVFGLSKATMNYFTGKLAQRFGRKKLLVVGWIFALPIPFILIHATSWNWVIFANLLLGINQGITWSSTIIMKIDLVGEKNRGFAMGLNEFTGYLSVGLMAFFTSFIAENYGISPYPFYLGIFLSILGFLVSLILVKDTSVFVKMESKTNKSEVLNHVFLETTFKNKTLSSVTQAGLINNLNDGMIWGLLPILLFSYQFSLKDIGIITAIYPIIWGLGQVYTGKMSDSFSKKMMLFIGMLLQALSIIFIPLSENFVFLILLTSILGIGTAFVYPTFFTTIASVTQPQQRAESIGVFRLWRDLGYVFGALISGILADTFGVKFAIVFVGVLTFLSAIIIQIRMPKN